MAKSAAPDSKDSDAVSFRLDPEFKKLLQAEAEKAGQPKPNLYARTLVQRALSNAEHHEVRNEFETLRQDLRRIREDMATLALVMLVKAAKEEPKKAEAWVREHFAP